MPETNIKFFNLSDNPPLGSEQIYKWVDYIEILCTTSIDREISLSDVVGRIIGNVGLNQENILQENSFETNSEYDDKIAELSAEWFVHFEYR